jgi:hypothetical protein
MYTSGQGGYPYHQGMMGNPGTTYMGMANPSQLPMSTPPLQPLNIGGTGGHAQNQSNAPPANKVLCFPIA